ncbi:MAG: hypothetical protein AAGD07_25505, partial [Planctomycetota bacterium]
MTRTVARVFPNAAKDRAGRWNKRKIAALKQPSGTLIAKKGNESVNYTEYHREFSAKEIGILKAAGKFRHMQRLRKENPMNDAEKQRKYNWTGPKQYFTGRGNQGGRGAGGRGNAGGRSFAARVAALEARFGDDNTETQVTDQSTITTAGTIDQSSTIRSTSTAIVPHTGRGNQTGRGRGGRGHQVGKVKSGVRYAVASIMSEPARSEAFSAISDAHRLLAESYDVMGSGRLDIDNHADTSCLDKTFRTLFVSDRVCEVQPFSNNYKPMQVAIGTGVTAVDTDSGTILLEIREGLLFGDKIDTALLNPNQARINGIDLCDDPFDVNRKFGLYDQKRDLYVPFECFGTLVGLSTRQPTDDEIRRSPRIILTSDAPWDPHNVDLMRRPKTNEFKVYSAITENVRVSAVSMVAEPDEPQIAVKRCECVECESDVVLSSVSSALTMETFVPRMVAAVNVATAERSAEELNPPDPGPYQTPDQRRENAMVSLTRHATVDAQSLSRRWNISLDAARNTLSATTQLGKRTGDTLMSWRYRAFVFHNRYRRSNWKVYQDTMHGRTYGLRREQHAQVTADEQGFVHVYPMRERTDCSEAVEALINELNATPHTIVVDGALEMVGPDSEYAKTCRRNQINVHVIEPRTPNQNRAERTVGELRRRWRRLRTVKRVPNRLWCYGMRWLAEVMSRTASSTDGRTPYERVSGDTPDISEYLDFDFYDMVWFWHHTGDDESPRLGRWLGIAHQVGGAMCYWILTLSGDVVQVLSRTSVQHVTRGDLERPEIAERVKDFDERLVEKLNAPQFIINAMHDTGVFVELEDDAEEYDFINADGTPVKGVPDIDDIARNADGDYDHDAYDEYVGAELWAEDSSGTTKLAKVIKRKRDGSGNPVGKRHQNPLQDTRVFEVEMPDGTIKDYATNVIAENIYSQVDNEGRRHQIFKEIADHKKDGGAVTVQDGFWVSTGGNKTRKMTTRGWQLLVEWTDGSQNWIPLKDLKESNPIEVAEYAVANKIDHEPAFAWWVSDTLRQRNRIISKVESKKSKYWTRTHKFGIRLPKTVEEALETDEENGNHLWRDAINKEMKIA